jgi:hypothetical protein
MTADASDTLSESLPTPSGEESDREILAAGVEQLERFFARDPQAQERLMEVLSRKLAGQPNARTWATILVALGDLVGDDGRAVVVWSSMTNDSDERKRRLTTIESVAPPAVQRLVRNVSAMFNDELWSAYDVADQYPHNWRSISREVYYDLVSARPFLSFRILKFNGEELLLEGPADSMLGLLRSFVVTLAMVENRDAFSPTTTEAFLRDLAPLADLLTDDSLTTKQADAPESAELTTS